MKRSVALLVTVVALVVGPSSFAQATPSESFPPAPISMTVESGKGSATPQAICRVFPRLCRW